MSAAIAVAIVVVVAFLASRVLGDAGADAWLLLALLVIGLSAAGGMWLRRVAAEEPA